MEQFDLFAEPVPVVTGYTPPKRFAFPSAYWESKGYPPLFRVACQCYGRAYDGKFWPSRRVVFGWLSHVPTRRAYSALAA